LSYLPSKWSAATSKISLNVYASFYSVLPKLKRGSWENIGVAVTASVTLEDLEHHVPVPLL
jgi:hypothetical protein